MFKSSMQTSQPFWKAAACLPCFIVSTLPDLDPYYPFLQCNSVKLAQTGECFISSDHALLSASSACSKPYMVSSLPTPDAQLPRIMLYVHETPTSYLTVLSSQILIDVHLSQIMQHVHLPNTARRSWKVIQHTLSSCKKRKFAFKHTIHVKHKGTK